MNVTCVYISGHGWWYAAMVIDYLSRYLLACHLKHSYSVTEVSHGLKLAREAAERIHGPHWALIPDIGGDPLVLAEVFAGGPEIRIPRWQPWATTA